MSLLKWLGLAEEDETPVDSLGEIERALTELIAARRDTSPALPTSCTASPAPIMTSATTSRR